MIKANNPELVIEIETAMSKIRNIISDPQATAELLSNQILSTDKIFNEVEETIKSR